MSSSVVTRSSVSSVVSMASVSSHPPPSDQGTVQGDILRIGRRLAVYGTYLCNRYQLPAILVSFYLIIYQSTTNTNDTQAALQPPSPHLLLPRVPGPEPARLRPPASPGASPRDFSIALLSTHCMQTSSKPYDPQPEISITLTHADTRKQR